MKTKKISDRDSYLPKIPWAEYLIIVQRRYNYKMPPSVVKGPHPTMFLDRVHYNIPGGILKQRRRATNKKW